jgi:hypothetical protein
MMNLKRKARMLQQGQPVWALELQRKQRCPMQGAAGARVQARKSTRDSQPGPVIACNGP